MIVSQSWVKGGNNFPISSDQVTCKRENSSTRRLFSDLYPKESDSGAFSFGYRRKCNLLASSNVRRVFPFLFLEDAVAFSTITSIKCFASMTFLPRPTVPICYLSTIHCINQPSFLILTYRCVYTYRYHNWTYSSDIICIYQQNRSCIHGVTNFRFGNEKTDRAI